MNTTRQHPIAVMKANCILELHY